MYEILSVGYRPPGAASFNDFDENVDFSDRAGKVGKRGK
jgi:hypothetical protein